MKATRQLFDLLAVTRLISSYVGPRLEMAKRNDGERAMHSIVIRITPRDGALLTKIVTSYCVRLYMLRAAPNLLRVCSIQKPDAL